MGSVFGKNIKISIFGQSHSEGLGVVIDGLPSGAEIDFASLDKFLERRKPKDVFGGTSRREKDEYEVLSGVFKGKTCGAPLCITVKNKCADDSEYPEKMTTPRPSHADYPAHEKYGGYEDHVGGGHFSGRLTLPLCIAGGICKQFLEEKGIYIGAHIEKLGGISGGRFDSVSVNEKEFEELNFKELPVIDGSMLQKMKEKISEAKEKHDSLGGVIECAIVGLPVGIGDPMFDGLENRIASAIFGIPAIKAIEFGNGFECAELFGSQNNDEYRIQNGKITTETNNCGGILGGISNGMPLIFRVAVKPTPTIGIKQRTVDLEKMTDCETEIKGRHDVCIVPRAVPCVEAAAAIAIYDAMCENGK